MEENATAGELIASLVYLIAGARLLRLSVITKELPERLLGASFLLMGVGSLLYSLAMFSTFEAWWVLLNFSGRVSWVIAFVLLAIFTQRVFRTEERWGRWIVYATVAFFVTGVGGSAMSGDWEGFSPSTCWYWLEITGYVAPATWTCVEAASEHIRARRRLKVGLCEPLVCNRLLLWASFAALQLGGLVISYFQYAAFERGGVFTAGWDYLYSAALVGSLVMIWIAFFPPAFYRRWIEGADQARTEEPG